MELHFVQYEKNMTSGCTIKKKKVWSHVINEYVSLD